jgi:2-polyprenyl-3-methyl-5-hydroxy-6-metoxy-1,4-benzoquinol methylase
MKTSSIKTINAYQQQIYDQFERDTVVNLLDGYKDVLEKAKHRKQLKIIDLGGGGGILPYSCAAIFLIKAVNCLC